jgi:hypothetical protein
MGWPVFQMIQDLDQAGFQKNKRRIDLHMTQSKTRVNSRLNQAEKNSVKTRWGFSFLIFFI